MIGDTQAKIITTLQCVGVAQLRRAAAPGRRVHQRVVALEQRHVGANGAVRAGLLGLGFAIFYALTGSIWLPILAHIALDVLQGMTAVEIFRKDDEPAENEVNALHHGSS